MTPFDLLDNIMWNTISGPHVEHSVGTDETRRYVPGFSPILGFVNAVHPHFDALMPFCEPGEQFYCDGWSGNVPSGWQLHADSFMVKMYWDGDSTVEDEAPDALPLDASHAELALDLATLTRPGPFGLRTLELGDYFGYLDGNRLMAMAGERAAACSLREISGVYTHPVYQGQGLARKLMTKLIHRESPVRVISQIP
jgi:GNAT superfamily N-acetyltransferase